MAVFRYKGMKPSGKEVNGLLDAASEREARQQLKNQDIYLTEFREDSLSSAQKSSTKSSVWNLSWGKKTSAQERIVFTRQLATLLSAGFPLVEALKAVEEQIKTGYLRQVITELRSAVVEGQALSTVMSRFPVVFPAYYFNLVRAGESGGALETVLEQLAEVMEAQAAMRSKLISAMIYPLIMAVSGFLILVFLMSVVVPRVVQVFQDTQQVLPLITRSLLAISDFFVAWGVLLIIGLMISTLLFSLWAKSEKGRPRFERILFRTPFVGTMMTRIITLRITQTLALLLRSGVQVIESLQITADATGFVTMQEELGKVSRSVAQGGALSAAMEKTNRFPSLALRLIQAGESSGKLEEMLERAAKIYEEEIRRVNERMMSMIEPMIVLLMGGVVAYVVVAVLLPIFEMNTLIR
ncbi:MAG: type II secretion system inner membrane protein GspF [Gammaproteobacteria bacterium]|nr:type II secretion system inner membrane protein GspF [Gammaproteobacteria bacterium]